MCTVGSLTRQFTVEAAKCNAECLRGTHWVVIVHCKNIFSDSTKLHHNVVNYRAGKCTKYIKCIEEYEKENFDELSKFNTTSNPLQALLKILNPKYHGFHFFGLANFPDFSNICSHFPVFFTGYFLFAVWHHISLVLGFSC